MDDKSNTEAQSLGEEIDEDVPVKMIGEGGAVSVVSSLESMDQRRDDGSKASSKLSTGTAHLANLEFEDVEGDDGKSGPWWIAFLKKEGLFDKDTSHAALKDDGVLDGDAGTASGTEGKETGTAQVDKDGAASVALSIKSNTDKSVTAISLNKPSSDGSQERKETDDEWKERLWLVARSNWNTDEEDPLMEVKTVAEAAEEAMLSSNLDQDIDHESIKTFQNYLLVCAHAYVQVFGDMEVPTTEADDGTGSNDHSQAGNGKSKGNGSVTSSLGKKSSMRDGASRLSPYVPLNIVRNLFQLVLWDTVQKEYTTEDEQNNNQEQDNGDDNENDHNEDATATTDKQSRRFRGMTPNFFDSSNTSLVSC